MPDELPKVKVVIHGHFYQPPREDPWTDEVPLDPSADPFHDWNERITAECYAPNGDAAIERDNQIIGRVNNYEYLSFNVGPTLAAWLAEKHPEVLATMRDAEIKRKSGLAQGFGHLILPLCNDRDLATQIRWGLADFRFRFGSEPIGMWLPEAAVNDRVMMALAEEGVRSTIIAEYQALATRRDETDSWATTAQNYPEAGPHKWVHPDGSGRTVLVYLYDPGLSQGLAFGSSGMSSTDFIQHIRSAKPDGGTVVIATDGETFGHHHKFVDRMLAYAFKYEAPEHNVEITNLSDLSGVVPVGEIQIAESSWSCAHGVGRWSRDCGCALDPTSGQNQEWREPLRTALDLLRDFAAEQFDQQGRALFTDPWAARDAYVHVLIGETPWGDFAASQLVSGADQATAKLWMQAQHFAMSMFTSCGWFFDDIGRQEPVQILRYAGRVLDILEELQIDTKVVTNVFLTELDRARSNDPEIGTGKDIFLSHARKALS